MPLQIRVKPRARHEILRAAQWWQLNRPAAQADVIVTRNLRDLARGELKFPTLRVLSPEQCLETFPCPP